MSRFSRNYYVYSAGLAVAWGILLLLRQTVFGGRDMRTFLLIFAGFCIGWVSTTIARYVYPPPKMWKAQRQV